MRKLALCMSLAIMTAFPGAVAFHNAEEPLLGSVSFSGNHWAAWRFTLASTGNIDIEAFATAANAELASVGTFLLRGDGSPFGALVFTILPGTTDVLVEALGNAPLVDITQGGANGLFGAAVTFNNVAPGEYIAIAVAAAAGGLSNGELALHASGGASLLGSTDGSDAFIVPSTAFRGTLNVQAAVAPAAQAMAIVGASHSETIEHTLFGLYQKLSFNPFSLVTCMVNYAGPNGGGAGSSIYFIQNAGAGTYTFNIPSCVDGGIGPFRATIWAVGADVDLP